VRRTNFVNDSGERVLVVEDEPDMNHLLCALLGSAGYRAEGVLDGPEAMDRVAADCPDAVVLDVMLPGMNGFEVCRQLKLRRETNLIPVLMLTALDDAKSRESGLRVGANRYVTKPFEPNELLGELRDVLDHRRRLLEGRVHTSVELHMDSDNRNREQINEMLSELFVFTPLSADEIHRIRYAALEMIENAAEWGNRRQKDLTVTIAYEVTDRFVKLVVTDQGCGFDPGNLPHAACEEDPAAHMSIREKLGLREGGFGIMISKGMVDKVEYNAAGNQVTLIKYFEPGAVAPPAGAEVCSPTRDTPPAGPDA
jgi:DNA-binding response OmpR family regulator